MPEPKEPVKRVGRTRAPARTPGTPKAAPVSTTKLPTFNAGELRLYHVTHISNLPAILESGKLFAASGPDAATPVVDISSVENREARKTVFVAGQQDSPVSAFVPFFLSPDAALWRSIRSGNPDSRLAADVAEHSINDFVVLVTTIDAVSLEGVGALANVVVADGDAAGSLTPFAANSASAVRMLRKLRSDEEAEALLEAEVLVADAVPVDNIALIGVANVKVREAVKRMLAPTPFATKVAAYTPWFEAVE
ncbi:DarT ssDNA thymidine ADP-ribosyltransferase family protein [Mycetocola manganoxydans]|uniref:DarT ssDNA thymidine ADP-ribosyltransferase family protein n=1 Tax=Mycetocola manganoxydans TaxID=699879 RepID=UPI0016006A24|nr:DarT ssDNA thymidine ADP-ribosyltransferase family protein [Mycetocola manganoxydans]